MTKRLTLFEFINCNKIQDFRSFVSDIVKNLNLIQEEIGRLNKTNIDIYAPEGVRAQLKNKANEVLLRLANTIKTPGINYEAITPDVEYLKDIHTILSHFKSEVGSDTVTNIKNLLGRVKQLFPDENKLFQAGQLANMDVGAMPLDPNTPAGTIETPLANQASNTRRDAGRQFDNSLGIQGLKNLGKVK